MEKLQLRKAERRKAKIRLGISAPSGAGKTYSALLLAKGITGDWSKIVMIDTEQGRGDLYSDLGEYNILRLEAPFSPERYIEAIKTCEAAGMEVIIIDSTTHEWNGPGGCLEINDKIAQIRYRGNVWAAWSETTPRHDQFIYAMVQSQCHIITTTRSKTETAMGEGKKVYKVGTKDQQREGFEYEFTVFLNLDRETHSVIVSKDNTHLFEGKESFVITTETGKAIKEWCESGKESLEEIEAKIKADLRKKISDLLAEIGLDEEWLVKNTGKPMNTIGSKGLKSLIVQLEGIKVKKAESAAKAAVIKKEQQEKDQKVKDSPETDDENIPIIPEENIPVEAETVEIKKTKKAVTAPKTDGK